MIGQVDQNMGQTTYNTQFQSGYGQLNPQAQPWPPGYNYGGGYPGPLGQGAHMYQPAQLPLGPPMGMPSGLPPGIPPMPLGIFPGIQTLPAPPPGLGHQTHPARGVTQQPGPNALQTPPKPTAPTAPTAPPPEEPNTESAPGISAAWMQQHTERVGLLLSLPDNDIKFTIEEVQTSVKTTLIDLEVEDPGEIDVMSRGRTGPYEVTLSQAARDAILTQGEVDVFQFEGDADKTFRVFVIDQFGAVVQSERAQEAEKKETERSKRIANNKDLAAERKGTQLRFFMDGTSQSAALEKTKRDEFFEAAMKKLALMVGAKCQVTPKRMTVVAVKDAFGKDTNKAVIFINLPAGTDGAEWVKSFRWDGMKYIHMERQVLPVKIRMDNKMIEAVGLKQCCFLPHCRGIPCPALSDAYALAECAHVKRGDRTHEPTWLQEKAQRLEETAGKITEAKMKAEQAVARRREKSCKQWMAGRCFKAVCPNKHGTPEETAMINCSHGTACNRTACPYRHGAEQPL